MLVDFDFGLAGNLGLRLNFLRSLLGDVQLVDQFLVVQNRSGIGFGERLQQLFLETVHGHLEIVQLFDELLFGVLEFGLFVVHDGG